MTSGLSGANAGDRSSSLNELKGKAEEAKALVEEIKVTGEEISGKGVLLLKKLDGLSRNIGKNLVSSKHGELDKKARKKLEKIKKRIDKKREAAASVIGTLEGRVSSTEKTFESNSKALNSLKKGKKWLGLRNASKKDLNGRLKKADKKIGEMSSSLDDLSTEMMKQLGNELEELQVLSGEVQGARYSASIQRHANGLQKLVKGKLKELKKDVKAMKGSHYPIEKVQADMEALVKKIAEFESKEVKLMTDDPTTGLTKEHFEAQIKELDSLDAEFNTLSVISKSFVASNAEGLASETDGAAADALRHSSSEGEPASVKGTPNPLRKRFGGGFLSKFGTLAKIPEGLSEEDQESLQPAIDVAKHVLYLELKHAVSEKKAKPDEVITSEAVKSEVQAVTDLKSQFSAIAGEQEKIQDQLGAREGLKNKSTARRVLKRTLETQKSALEAVRSELHQQVAKFAEIDDQQLDNRDYLSGEGRNRRRQFFIVDNAETSIGQAKQRLVLLERVFETAGEDEGLNRAGSCKKDEANSKAKAFSAFLSQVSTAEFKQLGEDLATQKAQVNQAGIDLNARQKGKVQGKEALSEELSLANTFLYGVYEASQKEYDQLTNGHHMLDILKEGAPVGSAENIPQQREGLEKRAAFVMKGLGECLDNRPTDQNFRDEILAFSAQHQKLLEQQKSVKSLEGGFREVEGGEAKTFLKNRFDSLQQETQELEKSLLRLEDVSNFDAKITTLQNNYEQCSKALGTLKKKMKPTEIVQEVDNQMASLRESITKLGVLRKNVAHAPEQLSSKEKSQSSVLTQRMGRELENLEGLRLRLPKRKEFKKKPERARVKSEIAQLRRLNEFIKEFSSDMSEEDYLKTLTDKEQSFVDDVLKFFPNPPVDKFLGIIEKIKGFPEKERSVLMEKLSFYAIATKNVPVPDYFLPRMNLMGIGKLIGQEPEVILDQLRENQVFLTAEESAGTPVASKGVKVKGSSPLFSSPIYLDRAVKNQKANLEKQASNVKRYLEGLVKIATKEGVSIEGGFSGETRALIERLSKLAELTDDNREADHKEYTAGMRSWTDTFRGSLQGVSDKQKDSMHKAALQLLPENVRANYSGLGSSWANLEKIISQLQTPAFLDAPHDSVKGYLKAQKKVEGYNPEESYSKYID